MATRSASREPSPTALASRRLSKPRISTLTAPRGRRTASISERNWPQRADASGGPLPPTPYQMRPPGACPQPAPVPREASARSARHASWTQFPTLGRSAAPSRETHHGQPIQPGRCT
eukprot:5249993-Pleurochrysis_carterae.AAC.1